MRGGRFTKPILIGLVFWFMIHPSYAATCGDGVTDSDEECDGGSGCAANCLMPIDGAPYAIPGTFHESTTKRGASHVTFSDGSITNRTVIWAGPHFFSKGGRWHRKNPRFVASGADDVTVGNDTVVKLTNATKRIEITDLAGNGIAFPLPARAVRTSGTTFTASVGAVVLTYTLTPSGVKAEAVFSSKVGARTWTINYDLLGTATASVDADGVFHAGPFSLPRPYAIGADGVRYDIAGPWELRPASKVRVAVNDSIIPSEALPYVLDPTTVYGATTDGEVAGRNAAYATAQSTSDSHSPTAATGRVGQLYNGELFTVARLFLEFDTSVIDDGAVITDAAIGLKCNDDYSPDLRQAFTVQINQYAWTSPLTAFNREANYDGCLSATYDSDFVLSTNITGCNVDPDLASYTTASGLSTAYINKTGTTQYCLISDRDVSATQPDSDPEEVYFYTADSTGTANDPYLEITSLAQDCCNCGESANCAEPIAGDPRTCPEGCGTPVPNSTCIEVP